MRRARGRIPRSGLACSLLLFVAFSAFAGNKSVPLPGAEVWKAPLTAYEAPGSCATCEGPRAFAVIGGTGWFLLHQSLVSTKGERIDLPYPGLDLAAGWSSDGAVLWVLTHETRFRVVKGVLVDEGRQGIGRPVAIGGDGTVETSETLAGQPPRSADQVPWAGGALELSVADGKAEARWNGLSLPFPGTDVVDARAVGEVEDGRVVVVLTDSKDRSATSGVRFFLVGAHGVEARGEGNWNGDVILHLRRYYAVDPTDGTVWTLVTAGDELSLRRYALAGRPGE